MTPPSAGMLGIGIVIFAGLFLTLLTLLYRRYPLSFRNITAFMRTRRAASMALEEGTRLHVSIGNANLLTPFGRFRPWPGWRLSATLEN